VRLVPLTSAAQGLVDELGGRVKVDAHVEGGRVMGLDALVGDVHAGVILGPTAPLALRTVQDVGDAQFSQLPPVRRDVSVEPGTRRRRRRSQSRKMSHTHTHTLIKHFVL